MYRRFALGALAAQMLAMTVLVGTQGAHAEGGARHASAPASPIYQQECAACHLAYPPGLLPAASWQRLMSDLSRHFGVDASLDASTAAEISTWLSRHADTRRGLPTPPEDRITRSTWFIRQHDDVSAATWKRASIRSASNCSACHSQATQGDFNEDRVRIPR